MGVIERITTTFLRLWQLGVRTFPLTELDFHRRPLISAAAGAPKQGSQAKQMCADGAPGFCDRRAPPGPRTTATIAKLAE